MLGVKLSISGSIHQVANILRGLSRGIRNPLWVSGGIQCSFMCLAALSFNCCWSHWQSLWIFGHKHTNTIDDISSRFEQIIYVPKHHPTIFLIGLLASKSEWSYRQTKWIRIYPWGGYETQRLASPTDWILPGAPKECFLSKISVQKSEYCLEFSITSEDGWKFHDDRSIYVQFSKHIL